MSDFEPAQAGFGRRLSTAPRARPVARLGVAAGSVLLLAACGLGEDPAVAEGRALYEANCQICHGEGGLGDGPMSANLPLQPVSLVEHVGHHSSIEMYRLITGGIPPAMPPHTLSETQVANIVAYIWTMVPEDRVAELREMQRQMEEMSQGGGAMGGMQMDHSNMPGMQSDSGGGSMPDM